MFISELLIDVDDNLCWSDKCSRCGHAPQKQAPPLSVYRQMFPGAVEQQINVSKVGVMFQCSAGH